MVTVIKDRLRGMAGQQFGLHYDKPSRRFLATRQSTIKSTFGIRRCIINEIPYPIEIKAEEVFGKTQNEPNMSYHAL